MWIYNGIELTENDVDQYVGFVYIIYNVTNGRKYIGKKLFTRAATYRKNKRKRRKRVKSDWLTYTGSNKQLNADIANGDQVQREILHLCTSKGWCTYLETQEIFNHRALIDRDYYNDWCSCKIRREHLK
jgi:hypothetical protein